MQCNKNCNDNTRQTPTVQEARETKHKPAQNHMLCNGALTAALLLELQAKLKTMIPDFNNSLKYLLVYCSLQCDLFLNFLLKSYHGGATTGIWLHTELFLKSSES